MKDLITHTGLKREGTMHLLVVGRVLHPVRMGHPVQARPVSRHLNNGAGTEVRYNTSRPIVVARNDTEVGSLVDI